MDIHYNQIQLTFSLIFEHNIQYLFQSYIPYSPSDGTFSQTGDGKFQLVMNRPYKQVDLRIAEQAMPCIVHYNTVYDLCALFGHGSLVQVKAEYRWQYWQRKYDLF